MSPSVTASWRLLHRLHVLFMDDTVTVNGVRTLFGSICGGACADSALAEYQSWFELYATLKEDARNGNPRPDSWHDMLNVHIDRDLSLLARHVERNVAVGP